ncbi:MAG: hypothetical protein PHE56_13965 [Bacteroidales bacterium]|nr:hypothetical protein [Bacteroidales bacterium]
MKTEAANQLDRGEKYSGNLRRLYLKLKPDLSILKLDPKKEYQLLVELDLFSDLIIDKCIKDKYYEDNGKSNNLYTGKLKRAN